MSQTTTLKIVSIEDARITDDGSAGIVTARTEDGRTIEIVTAPETGLRLARATRESYARAWIRQIEQGTRDSTDEGPNDPWVAQAVEVVLDATDPERVGLWARGTPMPPVVIMPTRQLPALIASAQQAIQEIGEAAAEAAGEEPGGRVSIPENTIRPAKIATAIGEDAIMVIATDEQGISQALMLDFDRIDEYVEAIRSTQAEALRQRGPKRLN